MSSDQWALDIAEMVCNATYLGPGDCYGGCSLLNFAAWLNYAPNSIDFPTVAGIKWSTALGMAMGAYSSASSLDNDTTVNMSVEVSDTELRWSYAIYVLVANVVVSIIMLVVAVRLRMASRLGGDFIDATRLLLNPLKNSELFSVSFSTTVDALGNPNMLVTDDNEFLLVEQALEDGQPMKPEAL